MTPGVDSFPIIVNVLPLPVAPYANTVALMPLSVASTHRFAVASYTSSCVLNLENTRSNTNDVALLLLLLLIATSSPPAAVDAEFAATTETIVSSVVYTTVL
jgi:hypothetical protein